MLPLLLQHPAAAFIAYILYVVYTMSIIVNTISIGT